MAALKKVRFSRMFQAVFRSDYRQTIRGMVFQQASHEDGSTMMVGGWKFPNEEQPAGPRGRPIPLTSQWFAGIPRSELLNFDARISCLVGPEVVDTAHPVGRNAKPFFQAVGVLMAKILDRLGNVDKLVSCCQRLPILIPNQ